MNFNYWFVLLPLQVVLMVWFGASCRKYNWKTDKIMKRDKKGIITKGLAIGMDIILMVAVVLESSRGIIQVIDNSLSADDDPAWSLILFALAIGLFACFMYYAFLGASLLGRQIKLACIREFRKR